VLRRRIIRERPTEKVGLLFIRRSPTSVQWATKPG
jgi:hypothetical protein